MNFIGGFSALVQKGMTEADRRLIAAIPQALAETVQGPGEGDVVLRLRGGCHQGDGGDGNALVDDT